jgi:hypothetical protein
VEHSAVGANVFDTMIGDHRSKRCFTVRKPEPRRRPVIADDIAYDGTGFRALKVEDDRERPFGTIAGVKFCIECQAVRIR